MNACIGTTCSYRLCFFSTKNADSTVEFCLNAPAVGLYLPAVVGGAVVTEIDEVTQGLYCEVND